MSTQPAPSPTRSQLQTALVQKCWKDPEFQKAIVSNPRAVIEKHIGRPLPPGLNMFVHEEDANTLHLSIPPAPSRVTELSDEELEKVAGGTEVVLAFVLSVVSVGVTVGAGTAAGTLAAAGKSPW